MAHATSPLRINAVELLRSPGLTRAVTSTLTPEALGLEDSRVCGDIDVAVTATSSVDGIVLHGTVATPWHAVCRRCLRDVDGSAVAAIDEIYQQHPASEDAIEIVGDQIDLGSLIREYALIELPAAPLCRDDCAGICPECGADRNESPCGCDTTVRDLRWSALEGLRLDDPAE